MSHKKTGDCFAGACEICNPPSQYLIDWKTRALAAEGRDVVTPEYLDDWIQRANTAEAQLAAVAELPEKWRRLNDKYEGGWSAHRCASDVDKAIGESE